MLFINMVQAASPSTLHHKSGDNIIFIFPASTLFSLKYSYMNLHEYQSKELLKKYNVPVQEGIPVDSAGAAEEAYKNLKVQFGNSFAVVKAQIHAGGRGKGKIVGTEQRGVNKVLVAQDVYYPGPNPVKEFYLSVLLDRAKGQNVIMYSTEGGMDIEEVAHKTPDKIFKEWVHPGGGVQPFQARKIAFNLGLSGESFKNCVRFVTNLYNAYVGLDCSMLEINPLFKTSDEKILAVDCKMNLDDNAMMRHADLEALRDISEEDPTEVEAGKYNLNFVKLDGNVGCMVNGAGLAMATMDMIKLSGGEPANFLDVGGTANAQTVEAGFRIILKDPKVKAILINIFGGIVRCDRVAQGVIDAYNSIGTIKVPIIVRLQGTNAEEAQKLIEQSGLKVQSAILLSEAAALVNKAVSS